MKTNTAIPHFIPRTITSRMVVATRQSLDDPAARVRELLADPDITGPRNSALASTAAALLTTPAMQLTSSSAAGSAHLDGPSEQQLGGHRQELRFARSAPHRFVVTSTAEPIAQPRHAQCARLLARALARDTFGVIADLSTRQILPDGDRPWIEDDVFVLGNDWISVAVTQGACQSTAHTLGMGRFGLPDLEASGFAQGDHAAVVHLLTALASRLLDGYWQRRASHPHQASHAIAIRQDIATTDFARVWGRRPHADAPALPVRLSRQNSTSRITIEQPTPQEADIAAWWSSCAAPAISFLLARALTP